MAEMLLHGANLRKAYEGRCILDGVSLSLEAGRFYALVGHSGSGKTTLLYLLALLEKPDEGEVRWQGQNLWEFSARERARWRNRHVGFVFQFFHLVGELRLWENVALPAVLGGSTFRAEKRKALEWLAKVGLEKRASERPYRLSGGEQQRVAIARALFLSPQILLADEPTGNLDAQQAQQVWELFLTLAREAGSAVLVATHNLGLAGTADKVYRLSGGKLYEESFIKSSPAGG